MLGKELRECLHGGKNVYGTHVTYMSNINAAGMLLNVGLDFAFFCGEHMTLDRIETGMLCRFFSANGVAPIARISHPDASEASKALDVGAHGIVVPYVETEEQVKELVGAVHYRPVKGRKLDDLLAGKEPVTAKMKEFFADFNRHNFLIIGIESIPAFENLDALINIKGVDGVFIGPHDMTTSMGCPNEYQNPEYIAVLKEIIIKCRKAGIGVGGHFQPGNTPVERMHGFMDLGMNWILDASDINYAVAGLSARRRSLGFDDVSPANAALKICGEPKTCAG
jgi:4-hydroxy-2-oxoheptanedioate aldolase